MLQQFQGFLKTIWEQLVSELAVLLLAVLWVTLRAGMLSLRKGKQSLRLHIGKNIVVVDVLNEDKDSPTLQESEKTQVTEESDSPKEISHISYLVRGKPDSLKKVQ